MGREARIQLLGTRGSVPVSGREFVRYGGGTSCVLVHMGGQRILLDAGTGILAGESALAGQKEPLSILVGHPHLDHLVGLPFFAPLYEDGREINIYGKVRGSLSLRSQLERIMSSPLWPVGPEVFAARVSYNELTEQAFFIGGVQVETMEGSHPGGSTVYKLSAAGRSLVYAVDFEHGPVSEDLAEFAAGCNLLLYDAMFTEEEYKGKRGFGHSTWQEGLALGLRCGAGQVVLTHHEPRRRDEELDALQEKLNLVQAAAGWSLPVGEGFAPLGNHSCAALVGAERGSSAAESGPLPVAGRPRCVFGKSGEEFFL